MLFLLSPAKALDYATPPHIATHTLPVFAQQASELIALLRGKTQPEVAALMRLSDALAALNVERYQAWSPKFTARNAKAAVLAFDGDVYDGLNAKTLSEPDLLWAQEHLCILSGLYGVLRPLDWMQPYRLEMGTALANARGKNLYQFWGPRIAQYLNERAQAHSLPLIVNLASEEYFKSVAPAALQVPVVTCVFEERKGNTHQVIGLFAKRARGLMMRHAIEVRAQTVQDLQHFAQAGYRYAPKASSANRLVFRRTPPSASAAA